MNRMKFYRGTDVITMVVSQIPWARRSPARVAAEMARMGYVPAADRRSPWPTVATRHAIAAMRRAARPPGQRRKSAGPRFHYRRQQREES